MSLPSVAKDKTSNKISLVTRPSVTLVQPAQVIGTSASQSQPTLIYVQSLQPSTQSQQQQSTFIGTDRAQKPKSFSQPSISIISSKTIRPPNINKIVSLPSTSTTSNRPQSQTSITVPNRVQTIHFKSHVTSAPSIQKPTIVSQTVNVPRPTALNDKSSFTKITKFKHIQSVPTNTPAQTKSSVAIVGPNAAKVDPVKYRYRTILENLLQLKNNFVRRTITQAIQQKLCNQSNEDLLNVIFKSFELTLLSVNVEQIHLNVSSDQRFNKIHSHTWKCPFAINSDRFGFANLANGIFFSREPLIYF